MRGDVTGRCRAVQKVNCRLQMIGGIAEHLLPAHTFVFSHIGPRP
jgi:hypothetical protein